MYELIDLDGEMDGLGEGDLNGLDDLEGLDGKLLDLGYAIDLDGMDLATLTEGAAKSILTDGDVFIEEDGMMALFDACEPLDEDLDVCVIPNPNDPTPAAPNDEGLDKIGEDGGGL